MDALLSLGPTGWAGGQGAGDASIEGRRSRDVNNVHGISLVTRDESKSGQLGVFCLLLRASLSISLCLLLSYFLPIRELPAVAEKGSMREKLQNVTFVEIIPAAFNNSSRGSSFLPGATQIGWVFGANGPTDGLFLLAVRPLSPPQCSATGASVIRLPLIDRGLLSCPCACCPVLAVLAASAGGAAIRCRRLHPRTQRLHCHRVPTQLLQRRSLVHRLLLATNVAVLVGNGGFILTVLEPRLSPLI